VLYFELRPWCSGQRCWLQNLRPMACLGSYPAGVCLQD